MSIKELEAKLRKSSIIICVGSVLITIFLFVFICINANRIVSIKEKIDNLPEYSEPTITVCPDSGCEQVWNINGDGTMSLIGTGYKITAKEAVGIIMDHFSLEFKYIPEKPSNVVVSKKE